MYIPNSVEAEYQFKGQNMSKYVIEQNLWKKWQKNGTVNNVQFSYLAVIQN